MKFGRGRWAQKFEDVPGKDYCWMLLLELLIPLATCLCSLEFDISSPRCLRGREFKGGRAGRICGVWRGRGQQESPEERVCGGLELQWSRHEASHTETLRWAKTDGLLWRKTVKERSEFYSGVPHSSWRVRSYAKTECAYMYMSRFSHLHSAGYWFGSLDLRKSMCH